MSTSQAVEYTREEQAAEAYKRLTTDQLERELIEFNESIDEMREKQDLFDSLQSLEKNDDWIAFKNSYFKTEKDRLVNALVSVSSFRDETEKQLHDKITSIRHLKMFLMTTEIDCKNSGESSRDLITFRDLIEKEISSRKTGE